MKKIAVIIAAVIAVSMLASCSEEQSSSRKAESRSTDSSTVVTTTTTSTETTTSIETQTTAETILPDDSKVEDTVPAEGTPQRVLYDYISQNEFGKLARFKLTDFYCDGIPEIIYVENFGRQDKIHLLVADNGRVKSIDDLCDEVDKLSQKQNGTKYNGYLSIDEENGELQYCLADINSHNNDTGDKLRNHEVDRLICKYDKDSGKISKKQLFCQIGLNGVDGITDRFIDGKSTKQMDYWNQCAKATLAQGQNYVFCSEDSFYAKEPINKIGSILDEICKFKGASSASDKAAEIDFSELWGKPYDSETVKSFLDKYFYSSDTRISSTKETRPYDLFETRSPTPRNDTTLEYGFSMQNLGSTTQFDNCRVCVDDSGNITGLIFYYYENNRDSLDYIPTVDLRPNNLMTMGGLVTSYNQKTFESKFGKSEKTSYKYSKDYLSYYKDVWVVGPLSTETYQWKNALGSNISLQKINYLHRNVGQRIAINDIKDFTPDYYNIAIRFSDPSKPLLKENETLFVDYTYDYDANKKLKQ